jgi:translation elongation factor EF-G
MKIFLYFLLAPGLLSEQTHGDLKAAEPQKFTVTVLADSFPSNERQLSYMSNGKAVNDTGKIQNGKLVFSGEIDNPDYATIYFFNTPEKVRFILEPGTTFIDFKESNNLVYKGSKTQDEYNEWNKLIEAEQANADDLLKQWVKKIWEEDYTALTFLEPQIDSAIQRLNQKKVEFIKKNKRSIVSGIMLANMFGNEDNKGAEVMYKELYEALDSEIKHLPYVQAFRENLQKNDLISMGQQIPRFCIA